MIRVNPDASPTKEGGKMHIMVCGGTGCTSSNSMKIIEGLESLIKINQLEDDIKVVKTGCFGLCAEGPIMMFYPEHIMYTLVQPEDVNEIFESHIMNGTPVRRLLAGDKEAEKIENAPLVGDASGFTRIMRSACLLSLILLISAMLFIIIPPPQACRICRLCRRRHQAPVYRRLRR